MRGAFYDLAATKVTLSLTLSNPLQPFLALSLSSPPSSPAVTPFSSLSVTPFSNANSRPEPGP